jgi:ectoine hydroxylase-related dioxygenase (phytanoyl-CoA dioxygenase family)
MTPDEVLAIPPKILLQAQRKQYFEEGYLVLERLISEDQLHPLRVATSEMIEHSRSVTHSNKMFVLESGHDAAKPRIRRLNCACDYHSAYWDYASKSILPDIVADLVGPDVKFREGMLNFKCAGGGDAVGWHQDIPFYPHTNLTPLITLLFLEEVRSEMGPLRVIPGSHKGELFNHYGPDGAWVGGISSGDLHKLDLSTARTITGPAGSVVVIHGCIVHGSERNDSTSDRPLLIIGYSSADAFCYTPLGNVSKYTWQIVRGQPARYAHHEAIRLRIPPDWSGGYKSIFEDQKGENRRNQYG